MDFQIFDILAPISLFFFMILALKLGRNLYKTKSPPNIPPGPWKLPIIGNIPHLITYTPHRKLRDLCNIYGPLMHLQLGEVSTIIVSSAEYAKEVMKTNDVIFASRPEILAAKIIGYDNTNIAFAPYGHYWRNVRRICAVELFTPKRINSFKPVREEEFTNLVKRVASSEKGSPFNLTRAVLSASYAIVSKAAFGTRCKDLQEFISSTKDVVNVAGGFDIGEFFPSAPWLQTVTGFRRKVEKVFLRNDRILQSIINEHKDANRKAKEGEEEEDLLDVLLKYHDNDGDNQDICLTSDNIKAIVQNIFAAGGETSATSINWAMAELIKNPRVMEKAQAEVRKVFKMKGRVDETFINEMKYLKAVVKETLRLHPAVPLLLPRQCGQACEINGYHIPFKSKVIVNAWAIGRDPKYWSEAERFYPERFIDSSIDYKGTNFEYIPFGAGRRICPGNTFGLINVELALAFLLYHFDWKLPNGMKSEDLDMTELFGLTVRRKYDLYLIPSLAT